MTCSYAALYVALASLCCTAAYVATGSGWFVPFGIVLGAAGVALASVGLWRTA